MKSTYSIPRDGFCARWFEGTIRRDHVVIVIPGTGTAEEHAVKQFGYFHRAGYSVLMLAHSLWEDALPRDPVQIPVEQLGLAIQTLQAEGFDKIALFGLSMGARYALLGATLYPEIQVVIAASAYDHLAEGVKGMLKPLNCSVHTWQGKDLPYMPIRVLHGFLPLELIRLALNPHYGLHNIMRYGYDSCVETEDSRIPVEKIQADILLLAPARDACWPSEVALPRMESHIRSAGNCKRLETILYPDGSHILATDLDATPERKKTVRGMLKGGGDQARRDSILAVLEFLKDWK